jgi:hypothetical protein
MHQQQQSQQHQRQTSPLPDYGDYNDDDDDYGASSSSRRTSNSRKYPGSGSGSRPGSSGNLQGNRSYGNLSVSSVHSQHSQHSQVSPLRSAQGTPPRLPPAAAAVSRAPAANPQQQQQQQQQSPKPQPQPQQQQQQLARTHTPDYGEYEDLDDYGGSSSRRKKGAKPRPGSAAGPEASSALAAANQALAGIPALPGGKKVSIVFCRWSTTKFLAGTAVILAEKQADACCGAAYCTQCITHISLH